MTLRLACPWRPPPHRAALALASGLALAFLPFTAVADPPAATAGLAPPLLLNAREPADGVLTGGLPATPEGYAALAAAGYRHIVDLRADHEIPADTRAMAEGAGLGYHVIPVAGEAELDLASARLLDALVDDPALRPLVVGCASGNRAGALLAVRAFWLEGLAAEPALDLGRRAGLTRLEPSVRLLLGLPPAPAPTPPPKPPDPNGTGGPPAPR